jgi:hypothetical protein
MEREISLEILNAEGKKIEFYKGRQPTYPNGEYKSYEKMVEGILRLHPNKKLIEKGISISIKDEEDNVLHEYTEIFQ